MTRTTSSSSRVKPAVAEGRFRFARRLWVRSTAIDWRRAGWGAFLIICSPAIYLQGDVQCPCWQDGLGNSIFQNDASLCWVTAKEKQLFKTGVSGRQTVPK